MDLVACAVEETCVDEADSVPGLTHQGR